MHVLWVGLAFQSPKLQSYIKQYAGPITPLSGADIPMVDGDGSVSAHYFAAN